MDGLDKIYQMQKQAAGSTKIPWYTKLKDWFKGRYSETGPQSVQGMYRIGKNGRKYPITAQTDVTKLKPGVITNDAALAGLTATTGYLSLKGNGTSNDAPTDGGKPAADESKPTADSGKTADGGKKDDGGGKTADDKQDFWDSAANWIKENPWLAGAGALGLGGLGYYAFSDDDDEEDEEEE